MRELDGIIERRATVNFRVKCGSKQSPDCVGREFVDLGTYDDRHDPENPHRPIREATRILREDMDWSGTVGLWICRPCMRHSAIERAGGTP